MLCLMMNWYDFKHGGYLNRTLVRARLVLCDEHRRTANSVDPVWYSNQADATTQLQSFRFNVRGFLLVRGGQITILLRFLETVQ